MCSVVLGFCFNTYGMAALNIFLRRAATQLPWCREITLKNARSVQCSLHSYSSWTNDKSFTRLHRAPLNHLGFRKNAHGRKLLFSRQTCSKTNENLLNLTEDSCPQGIQGDDCTTFKIWMENCQRYGLENCQDQLQGVQSGRKTLSEVFAEQNKLIEEIAEQYRISHAQDSSHINSSLPDRDSIQGCQDMVTAFPSIDTPCPQGVQGSDCARFKLWLENCHRFGFGNCTEQYQSYKEGRKTLAQIFDEQDKTIREVAASVNLKNLKNTRKYSTVSGPDKNKVEPTPETGQLSQKDKLKRAVKEYGSTVVIFHVSISLMSLGFFYLLVSSGIDVVGMLKNVGIGGTLLDSKLAAGTGTFVVAYAVHKVFAPARIATTLTATPFIVRYLRRIGVLKTPSSQQQKT